MSTALALILVAAALALSGGGWLADPVGSRLMRLVPERFAGAKKQAGETRYLELLYRTLAALDPSFRPSEDMLHSLGIARREWVVVIEIAKLFCAATAGFIAIWLAAGFFPGPIMELAAFSSGFAGLMFAIHASIRAASFRRRARIRRELAFGIEMLCIFLEGGQSLDQAFRSFCDVGAEALPLMADIQRRLIAELNSGVPYEKAIEHWAENIGSDEAKPLAALFVDSLVHGTELVPHLRQFSIDLIEQRISALRASIGVKSSQLTVVMVVFFLPAILAFVTAPAIAGVAAALGASR